MLRVTMSSMVIALWLALGHSVLANDDQAMADLVIVNGKLYRPHASPATALAIKGDHIVAVGSLSDIEKYMAASTVRIDAGQCTVTPGIHDAHVHFLSGSLSLTQIELGETETIAQIEAAVSAFVTAHPTQSVFQGRGWVYGAFPSGLPDRQLLDRLIPDRPAILKCYDGHTVWVNSKALQAAGITRHTPDPVGGIIVRDPSTGEPTGVLKENALKLVQNVAPEPSRDDKLSALRTGMATAHRFGVTSVGEAGIGLPELDLLESLRSADQLPLRFSIALSGRPRMLESEIDALDDMRRRYPQLDIGAVKLYADGVIEAHTAALLAPYANRATTGLPETSAEDLNRLIEELDKRGWQVMVHAIGDGGIRMTLDAFERAQQINAAPSRGRRHRLEHIESISQEDITRFAQLGLIASMQPYHASPNGNIFNVWAANLGPERASRAWAWKSIQDAGGKLAFGSDWPVVGLDPRLGMHTALTRQTLQGEPRGGFLPEQQLPLASVLDAYTRGAAYASFDEDRVGDLEVNQLADVVIWNNDLFKLAPAEVHTAAVVKTIFNGRVVYDSQNVLPPASANR